jgi:Bacterial Ig domain
MTSGRIFGLLATVPLITLSGVLASACGSSDVVHADADADADTDAGANTDANANAADGREASEAPTFSGVEDQRLSTPVPGLLVNEVDGRVVPTVKTTAAGGKVTLSADGSFEYEPPADFFGDDSFTYELGSTPPRTATAKLVIEPVNDPPTIAAPANVVLDSEPGAITVPAWLSSWTSGPVNESSQSLTFTLVPQGTPGLKFDAAPTLDAATGALSLAVTPASFGSAQYRLEVRDNGGTAHGGVDVATAEFAITVNTPPIAVGDSFSDMWNKTCVRVELTANDTDIDGDPIGVQVTDIPDSGKLYVYDPNAPDGLGIQMVVGVKAMTGSFCYKPNSRFFVGVDQLKYQAIDGRGGVSPEVVVTITIVET